MTKYRLVTLLNELYKDGDELLCQIIDERMLLDVAHEQGLSVTSLDMPTLMKQIEKKCAYTIGICGFTEDDIAQEIMKYLEERDNL